MKTLHLPLKAKWYEMIESGAKTEEYREIKTYWENRIRCQAFGVCTLKNRVYKQDLLEYVIYVTPTSSSPTAIQSEQ